MVAVWELSTPAGNIRQTKAMLVLWINCKCVSHHLQYCLLADQCGGKGSCTAVTLYGHSFKKCYCQLRFSAPHFEESKEQDFLEHLSTQRSMPPNFSSVKGRCFSHVIFAQYWICHSKCFHNNIPYTLIWSIFTKLMMHFPMNHTVKNCCKYMFFAEINTFSPPPPPHTHTTWTLQIINVLSAHSISQIAALTTQLTIAAQRHTQPTI
jgi:hypothetical protein